MGRQAEFVVGQVDFKKVGKHRRGTTNIVYFVNYLSYRF